jgi:probable HAF family extracellular repeat protein
MKSNLVTWLAAATLLTLLTMPLEAVAQGKPQPAGNFRYEITDLGTLNGGNFSQPFAVNSSGEIAGSSNLSNNDQHAVLWFKGQISDLGTLGGSNSIAFGFNDSESAVGEAETSASDPNGEDFCGFGTHLICQPFSWRNSVMTPLHTLGGYNGGVMRINRWGVSAGFAETSNEDPACPAPQKLQFKPAAWAYGWPIELPTKKGDPDGVALGINDHGDIVGSSGICSTFNPNTLLNLQGVHALLWENGKTIDLGNLGGKTGQALGNLAFAINNRGQVVGISDLPGDTTSHGFLWTKATRIQDLRPLKGDIASAAISIDDDGVIVGLSVIDAKGDTRAVVWRNRVPVDLNTLVQGNAPLYLLTGCSINSRGEITGLGLTSNGEIHTYLATPTHGVASSVSTSQGVIRPRVLSDDARKVLQRQLPFGRFGAGS